jgi:hypothetical protein
MHSAIRVLLIIAITGLIIAGCAGNNSQPTKPDEVVSLSEITGNAEVSPNPYENSHYLLSYNLIYVDSEGPTFDIIPMRAGEIHLNILKFLEDGPCTNCFKVSGLSFLQPGYLNFDIQIDHPFDDLTYSVFDVRGIIMFQGSHGFPVAGKSISDPALGDGALLNADGYTALYNGSTIDAPVGGLQKYYPGNLSTLTIPNSDINGFKYFTTDNLSNNRNAFFANSSDVQTYSLKLQTGPFILGYAVDATWRAPISTPVDDPLTDFDLNANCPEAWKIDVQDNGPGLMWEGGTTNLQIDVFDWQGKDEAHPVMVECPDLFDGEVQASWMLDGSGFTRYGVEISNVKNADGENYPLLVRKEPAENNPSGQPWLDLTAYKVFMVSVVGNITNPIDITPQWPNFVPSDIATEGNYAYITGKYGLHIFDISDPINPNCVKIVDTSAYDDWRVAVSDGYAYMIGYKSLEIIKIDPPESAYIVNSIALSESYLHDIAASDGYVCVKSDSSYLKIYDVDPPESAHLVSQVSTQPDRGLSSISMSGGYAYYVTSYQENGGYYNFYYYLYIIDMNIPESAHIVNKVPVWYTGDIAVSDGYAYLCESNGIRIIDIEPPESASTVKVLNIPGPYGIAASDGYVYKIGSGSLKIIDVDPPESPYIVKILDIPGGLHDGIALFGGYAYATGSDFGFLIVDIEPLSAAYCLGAVYSPSDSRDVAVSGGYSYVADGVGGLKLVDIEPPGSPYIVNDFAMQIETQAVEVSNGYAYVAMWKSLQIIDIDPPGSAFLWNEVTMPVPVEDVTVSDGYAYAAMGASLQIIDIDPPESAYIVNSVDCLSGYAHGGIAVSGSYAYLARLGYGLQIIDIDPPESAYIVNTIDTEHANDVAVSGGYAYVADDYIGGLKIIDIDPPESAYIVNTVDTPGYALGVVVHGSYAFVADGNKGLQIIDIDPPESAYIVGSVDTADARRVAVSGGYAYVADLDGGLRIIKLW